MSKLQSIAQKKRWATLPPSEKQVVQRKRFQALGTVNRLRSNLNELLGRTSYIYHSIKLTDDQKARLAKAYDVCLEVDKQIKMEMKGTK